MDRLRREAGFSLVEGLVAGLVLVIGIGAAVTVFVSSGHAGASAERHQSAVALAQRQIEDIRAMDYDEVGLTSTVYEQSGLDLPDPAARVNDGYYFAANYTEAEGGLPAERLVVADAGQPYAIHPYEEIELESRSGPETAYVYRFVTWRDEECPLLKLTDLNLDLAGLGSTVTSLLGGLRVSLAGQGLVPTAEDSRGALSGLTGIDGAVLQRVNEQLAMLDELLDPANQLLNQVINPVADPLIASLSALSGIDFTLDLCDLDLGALQRLKTIGNALAALQEPLSQLTTTEVDLARSKVIESRDATLAAAQRQAYCKSHPLSVNCLLSGIWGALVSAMNNTVHGLRDLLGGQGSSPGVTEKVEAVPADVNEALTHATDDSITDIGQLPGFINDTVAGLNVGDTDENTKRVVVAVVLEHGGSGGPRQPIWVSTVITDPQAGLLRR